MFKTLLIKITFAASIVAATFFTAPATVDAAHWLSSAQEKEAGNAAVAEFQQKYRTYRDEMLDNIQKRLIENNPDRLWFYGQKTGKKRGLEPVLMADISSVNAYSYPGGQVFIYQGMLDLLASRNEDGTTTGPKNPWKVDQIYQMSALAATMGHEFAHWSNEDWLRSMDKQITTRFIVSMIPAGNIWGVLGLAAGSNLINALNSRQMGFRTEQQADEWAMKFCENVPEYSIGGEAIVEYRSLLYEQLNGGVREDWLHPHSKTAVRLKRALDYQYESSNGFIDWKQTGKGYTLYINGECKDYLQGREDVSDIDRTFYVMGQFATAIKMGIAADYNLKLYRGDELFTNGKPEETYALFEKETPKGRAIKMLDKYTIPKDKIETIMRYVSDSETFKRKCSDFGVSLHEMMNYTYPLVMLRTLQEHRIKYSMPAKCRNEGASRNIDNN